MGQQAAPISCRSYTSARRHPMVIGKIAGWALPTPLTPAQLAVLVGAFLVLLATRGVWAHLGGAGNLIVQAAVPLAACWCVRHLKVEGRPPLRALAGYLGLAFAPRLGVCRGRAHREYRARRLRGTRLFVQRGS